LRREGGSPFTDVRIGKRFELTVEGEITDAVLEQAQKLAEEMLSNSVIENVVAVKAS
jgi:phosphoribosylformylglycinamidine synthase